MADLATAVEILPEPEVQKAIAAEAALGPLLTPVLVPALVPALGSRPKDADSPAARRAGILLLLLALAGGLAYIAVHLTRDIDHASIRNAWPLVLLGSALVIALGFEFVNGFHDTANAVATVIYTHSLEPHLAVVWSGLCNLAGVLFASGTVAYAVVTLLPIEIILKVSSGTGFAMVFALLIAAILWNLGTWWLGLPSSSSHTLVGSIIGVGLASEFINAHSAASGLDWSEAIKVLEALLISPVMGFVLAGLLILLSKRMMRMKALHKAPKDGQPPPMHIRALMVLTCTGVSFFHGSNDGQKGMGLIMLILIGTLPTAYALNRAATPAEARTFLAASAETGQILDRHIAPNAPDPDTHPDPRAEVTRYIQTRHLEAGTVLAVRQLVSEVDGSLTVYKTFNGIPAALRTRVRNEMYLTSEALRLMSKAHEPAFTKAESAELKSYRGELDKNTRFIPTWVKVAVALALGLGTMVGWKRIVVTVGERIGQEPMTYAEGAAASLVTMATIFGADTFGLPVSTTHILSSGVAGTMAANGSGLRWSTVRAIAAGWMLTLPAAALLSGLLYCLFHWMA